jgi:hypothetical protein
MLGRYPARRAKIVQKLDSLKRNEILEEVEEKFPGYLPVSAIYKQFGWKASSSCRNYIYYHKIPYIRRNIGGHSTLLVRPEDVGNILQRCAGEESKDDDAPYKLPKYDDIAPISQAAQNARAQFDVDLKSVRELIYRRKIGAMQHFIRRKGHRQTIWYVSIREVLEAMENGRFTRKE